MVVVVKIQLQDKERLLSVLRIFYLKVEIVRILLTVHFWGQVRVESKHLWQDMSLFCVHDRVTSDSDLCHFFFFYPLFAIH